MRQIDARVYSVFGGFHLVDVSDAEVSRIATSHRHALQALGRGKDRDVAEGFEDAEVDVTGYDSIGPRGDGAGKHKSIFRVTQRAEL